MDHREPYVISPIKTAAVANAVLAVLETKHQKARHWYAKLTDEQKTQRNAKRREAYAMKKSASRAPEMCTLVADAGNNYAKN